MRGYDRDELNDYDGYESEQQEEGDEYEDDEGEEYEDDEGEGYVEAPPRQPTKEEIEYLGLRQKLKENHRKQLRKENSASLKDCSATKKKLPNDNFGSFFGPSQPVIAPRVIQESKSLLENQHLQSRLSNTSHVNKNVKKVSNGVMKPSSHKQPPKVSETKIRAQTVKDTRDYSFLMSDDAELPAPAKELPSRNTSVHNSEGRPAQVARMIKQPLINGGKPARGSGENRKPAVGAGHSVPKSGPSCKLSDTNKSGMASVDSRKQLGSNSGIGPGRPVVSKQLPSKMPASTMGNKSSTLGMKRSVNGVQKPLPSKLNSSAPKQFVEQRRDVRVQNKPLPSKVHSSAPKQIVDQRKDSRDQNKPKMVPKQPVASSRAQVNKPPLKQIPKRSDLPVHHPKNKVGKRHPDEDEDEDDGMDYRNMIRSMFNYNPNKFVGDDDDDNMEAGFDEIMREEKRSALIAKKEDEEQLRLIEEQEERERRRRMAKFKKRRVDD